MLQYAEHPSEKTMQKAWNTSCNTDAVLSVCCIFLSVDVFEHSVQNSFAAIGLWMFWT